MVSQIESQMTSNNIFPQEQFPNAPPYGTHSQFIFIVTNKCGILYDILMKTIDTTVILALATVLNDAALWGMMIL